jgi:hypothetical protein
MRPAHLIALLCAAVLLAGCGSDDEEPGPGIPADLVAQFNQQLDLVRERLEVTRDTEKIGSCNDIELKSIPDLEALTEQVPDDTDPEIRDTLEQGISRLRELASQECSDLEDELDSQTNTTPEETVPEETTPPETETTPPETETTPPETTPEQQKKDKDKGGGGATPPGQGGGGLPAPLPGDGD